jgi:hypothetical protein
LILKDIIVFSADGKLKVLNIKPLPLVAIKTGEGNGKQDDLLAYSGTLLFRHDQSYYA